MNTLPEEFQFDVSSASSPIVGGAAGAAAMKLYSVPNNFEFQLSMPNPGACGQDPLACLPTAATECNPATGVHAPARHRQARRRRRQQAQRPVRPRDQGVRGPGHNRRAHQGALLRRHPGRRSSSTASSASSNEAARQLGIDLPALLGTNLDLNLAAARRHHRRAPDQPPAGSRDHQHGQRPGHRCEPERSVEPRRRPDPPHRAVDRRGSERGLHRPRRNPALRVPLHGGRGDLAARRADPARPAQPHRASGQDQARQRQAAGGRR